MSSNLNVTVSLDPIWERFDAVDANASILTDRVKRLEERARAEDDGNREALAMANRRVKELERQLASHHEHEASMKTQVDLIARAIAGIPEATDDPIMPIGQRVRIAIDTLSLRAGALQGELQGMHYREQQVDKVIAAWDVKRGGLDGYDGTIDPETPAGRVVELLRDLTKVRPNTTPVIKAHRAALDAIYAELGEYGLLQDNDGDYAESIAAATRAALTDRATARQQLKAIERTIASIPAEGRTIADRVHAAFTALITQARQDTGAAAATRIRELARGETTTVHEGLSVNDAIEFNAYLAGLERAAQIAAGETPEADPDVAHIDTVNGRQRPAQAPTDTTTTE